MSTRPWPRLQSSACPIRSGATVSWRALWRAGRESECAEDRLRGFARERLAAYKVPKQIVVMTDLPRNAVGKVMKPELVKKLAYLIS